jgi:N-acetyl-anhydromuramyl-L-alanine amidase AmpD
MLPSGHWRIGQWMAVGLLNACLLGGCTRPAVVAPPTSAPTTLPSAPVYTPPPSIPSTPEVPASGVTYQNLWKPDASPRDWKYIVLHHTATESGSVESIHESHLQNKDKSGKPWLGIGYHFVIGNGEGMGDGDIEPTFRWKQQMHGAHAGASDPEYNQVGIGICLVGNFEEQPPTSAQMSAVKTLVQTLKSEYRISSGNIIGHRDVRETECPGKLFTMDKVLSDRSEGSFADAAHPAPAGKATSTLAERDRSTPR